jgi:hypothetical protein
MLYYLILQAKRIYRYIGEAGVHPLVGLLIIFSVFLGFSIYLFENHGSAAWIFSGFALYLVFSMGNQQHRVWMQGLFSKRDLLLLRGFENLLVTLPFLSILSWKGFFLQAGVVGLAAILLSLFDYLPRLQKVIPTPFKKIPFENIQGFRKTVGLILIAYFVCWQGIRVENFNLSLATSLFMYFLVMGFYYQPEKRVLVWIFACSPSLFLLKKIRFALQAVLFLNIPILIALLFYYPQNVWLILGLQALGLIYLAAFLLARYAAYPQEMGIPQALLFVFSFWFPPMLLIIIPIFYRRAIQSLQSLLQ